MQEKIRAFIAIELPKDIIEEIKKVQQNLAQQKFTGKLTEPENLHLTLKFLGEIDQKTLDKIKSKLEKIKLQIFTAVLKNVGTFSKRKIPRIVWIKIEGQELLNLQKEIDEALEPLLKPEERFMSHLTIARIKRVENPLAFNNHVKKTRVSPLSFKVKEFKLKSSELKPEGPVYKTLKNFSLT